MNGGRRVAVQAGHGRRQEVGGTDHGDVDVGARLGQGGRVAGVVVGRVREVHAHAVGARAVLAEPRPIVRITGLAVADRRSASERGFLSTEELPVVVDVDLQGHWIGVPWDVGPVRNSTGHFEAVAGVHLGHDFAAHGALRIVDVHRTTRRHVAVGSVRQTNEPVRGVGADEVPEEGGLTGQGGKVAVPAGRVWLQRRDAVEVEVCGVQGGLVPQRGPVAEGPVSVVDGGIEVIHRTGALHDQGSIDVHAMHDADGEGFRFIAVHVSVRPFRVTQSVHGQLWIDLGHDLQIARWQARVGVVVSANHRVAAGLSVPQDFLVRTRDLARPIVVG